MESYKNKKVIPIGTVSELTGLSVRKIRYYEERKLVIPERSKGKTRKYSFDDIDLLVEIANKMEDGFQTYEIRKIREKQLKSSDLQKSRDVVIKGQRHIHYQQHNLSS